MANKTLQVFISGTVADLREYRQAALDACLRVGVVPLAIEHFGASGESIDQAVASAIDHTDVYLAIIGERYGAVFSGQGKSFTEIEYELAGEKGIPRLVFIKSEDHAALSEPGSDDSLLRLQQFKRVVRQSGFVSEFRSVDELKAQVVTALVDVGRSLTRGQEQKSVMLLLPYGEPKNDLRRYLRTMLEQKYDMEVYELDQMSASARSANARMQALQRSDIIIAEVTDSNPNVMYELGFAHSLRKLTILLAESSFERSLPFDLHGFDILAYDLGNFNQLEPQLTRRIEEYTKEEWRR